MGKLKADMLLEEYKQGIKEIAMNRAVGIEYRKNKPLTPWRAINMAFHILESINNRLKVLEGRGGAVEVDDTKGR